MSREGPSTHGAQTSDPFVILAPQGCLESLFSSDRALWLVCRVQEIYNAAWMTHGQCPRVRMGGQHAVSKL